MDILQEAETIRGQALVYQREKALFVYFCAFERGDFDRMGAILAQAEHDPVLEEMIWQVHVALAAEEE